MDLNVPDYISRQTLIKADRLYKSAKKIGYHTGNVRWGDFGDYLYFMFTNNDKDLVLVYCIPSGYILEHHFEVDGKLKTQYAGVKNIRNQLLKLRKHGFYDCEYLGKEK